MWWRFDRNNPRACHWMWRQAAPQSLYECSSLSVGKYWVTALWFCNPGVILPIPLPHRWTQRREPGKFSWGDKSRSIFWWKPHSRHPWAWRQWLRFQVESQHRICVLQGKGSSYPVCFCCQRDSRSYRRRKRCTLSCLGRLHRNMGQARFYPVHQKKRPHRWYGTYPHRGFPCRFPPVFYLPSPQKGWGSLRACILQYHRTAPAWLSNRPGPIPAF